MFDFKGNQIVRAYQYVVDSRNLFIYCNLNCAAQNDVQVEDLFFINTVIDQKTYGCPIPENAECYACRRLINFNKNKMLSELEEIEINKQENQVSDPGIETVSDLLSNIKDVKNLIIDSTFKFSPIKKVHPYSLMLILEHPMTKEKFIINAQSQNEKDLVCQVLMTYQAYACNMST